ncbi:cysteinyl-tRNA synthetase [Nematocida displodere]|uniref:cysteine--tRNA ligase n=1 Tax=Nematocida displodere TaxID=1805483 RepID=A0A177EF44_9MICR|nr:cysteinyl-tRNA synthetase [Nematocida displodere]
MVVERVKNGVKGQTALKVHNTITGEKEELKIENGVMKWYTCGPTVYDSSHIGHARSYILLDALRKTLTRYFGHTVTYIMNITDIDDKIIIKARESLDDIELNKLDEEIKRLSITISDADLNTEDQKRIHIATKNVSRKYEQEFFRDMAALDIDLPTYTTRVSEYIEEIVRFAERIEEQGYAYVSNGSLYFDVRKYAQTKRYPLMCSTQNRQELLEEGEGKLTEDGKRSKEDFVLWKRSKAMEPAWASKWGAGRPGWHIECSAMASNITGGRIDMHSGGIDLMFPHHDNEIAQSEGAGLDNWVGHFLHTGHLHIDGFKMSKSLKNFIKIEEMLEKGTSREIRIMFLLQSYRGPMRYGLESLERAKVVEKKIFRYIGLHLPQKTPETTEETVNAVSPLGAEERALLDLFDAKVIEIDSAIKDDFDFPKVFDLVIELITAAGKSEHPTINREIAQYIGQIMHVMGLETAEKTESADVSQLVATISAFRNEIRGLAKASSAPKAYFVACDKLRSDLSSLGIVIEDGQTAEGSSIRRKC